MWLHIIILIASLALLSYAADRFIESAVSISVWTKLPSIWVGMVWLGVLTSIPEILVSYAAIHHGHLVLAMANALGSYVVNLGLVLGLTAMWMPMKIKGLLFKRELPLMAGVYLCVVISLANGVLAHGDALFFVLVFVGILALLTYWVFSMPDAEPTCVQTEGMPVFRTLMQGVLSGLALWVSAKSLVTSATFLASYFGMSDHAIGVSVVAIGTSLPELAATWAAARRGHDDLAVGNVMGSNIFGLLAIMGMQSFMAPGPVLLDTIAWDLGMMGGMTLILCGSWLKKQPDLGRIQGAMLFALFLIYLFHIFS